MGRPPIIKSPQEMAEKMEAYFAWCDANPVLVETITKNGNLLEKYKPSPYVLEEMAIYLGFCGIAELNNYKGGQDHLRAKPLTEQEKADRQEYTNLITRAKDKIAGRLVRYGELGVYESKITSLVLATHHGYNTKSKEDIEQNFTFTFVDETKSGRKKVDDRGKGENEG